VWARWERRNIGTELCRASPAWRPSSQRFWIGRKTCHSPAGARRPSGSLSPLVIDVVTKRSVAETPRSATAPTMRMYSASVVPRRLPCYCANAPAQQPAVMLHGWASPVCGAEHVVTTCAPRRHSQLMSLPTALHMTWTNCVPHSPEQLHESSNPEQLLVLHPFRSLVLEPPPADDPLVGDGTVEDDAPPPPSARLEVSPPEAPPPSIGRRTGFKLSPLLLQLIATVSARANWDGADFVIETL
jgi:hypothetical protein